MLISIRERYPPKSGFTSVLLPWGLLVFSVHLRGLRMDFLEDSVGGLRGNSLGAPLRIPGDPLDFPSATPCGLPVVCLVAAGASCYSLGAGWLSSRLAGCLAVCLAAWLSGCLLLMRRGGGH